MGDRSPDESGVAALVMIDPYNDFTSRLGKGWPLLRSVAADTELVRRLSLLLDAARRHGQLVAYAPHKRFRSTLAAPTYPTPSQYQSRQIRFFSARGRGGKFHKALTPRQGEFVASEHATASGFGGTDLHEHLQSHSVTHLVVCGLLTNTCIESTARQGVDLGYHVTVVSDAVATWSRADHHAALGGSLPLVAHALATTDTVITDFGRETLGVA